MKNKEQCNCEEGYPNYVFRDVDDDKAWLSVFCEECKCVTIYVSDKIKEIK